VIVVSNSSPLITLARVGQFDLLRKLFSEIHIADEVRQEVVVRGAGRPAAETVRGASWIKVHAPAPAAEILQLRSCHPLGAGELATILLARLLKADLTVIDERSARRLAQAHNLRVMGCVGVLETGHRKGLLTNLRETYEHLLLQGTRVDRQILDRSLAANSLKPL
jgi:predicted nucleic acid-binding protein